VLRQFFYPQILTTNFAQRSESAESDGVICPAVNKLM
jgi:hypothetical protein